MTNCFGLRSKGERTHDGMSHRQTVRRTSLFRSSFFINQLKHKNRSMDLFSAQAATARSPDSVSLHLPHPPHRVLRLFELRMPASYTFLK